MKPLDIIRAWKDEEYRRSLSEEQRALLPEHPAGFIELADAELEPAAGGEKPWTCTALTTLGTYFSQGWRCR